MKQYESSIQDNNNNNIIIIIIIKINQKREDFFIFSFFSLYLFLRSTKIGS